jgi:hypothetical protein
MVRIIEPRALSIKESYKFFLSKLPSGPVFKKSQIPYWMYKEVISRINKKASDAIILGDTFNLQNNLGYIRIKKIRRNYMKPVPDWGASNKLKAQLVAEGKTPKDETHPDGEEWIVFFTDPWYLRWAWIKKGVCRVKNQTVYEFRPTSNRSKTAGDNSLEKLGNKGKLVLANRTNPVLHSVYDH